MIKKSREIGNEIQVHQFNLPKKEHHKPDKNEQVDHPDFSENYRKNQEGKDGYSTNNDRSGFIEYI